MSNLLDRFLGSPLSPEERRRVIDELFVFGRTNRRQHLDRMAVLLILSTIIAACGLMADSAAVVIGAMLVAPLMRPVMAAAAAIALAWATHLYQSLLLVFGLALGGVLISLGIALVSPDFVLIPDQVLARTEPTFYDLVIALAAGSTGAYTLTRSESSAVPGVAIAVALLPPLAATGVLVDFGELELALRAFVLFVINFLAMILAGSLTFLATGVTPPHVASRFRGFIQYNLFAVVVLMLGISVPLSYYTRDVWFDADYQAANTTELQRWLAENQLELDGVSLDETNQVLSLELLGPDPPMTIEGLYELLDPIAEERGATDWRLDVTWTQRIRSSWPPPEAHEVAEAAPSDTPPDPAVLRDQRWAWRATQYNDEEWIGLDKAGVYEFEFVNDLEAAIRVDCNRALGTYHLSGFGLRFDVAAATRAACPEPDMDAAFLKDLNRVVNYRIVEETLVLRLDNNAGIMHFDRAEPEPES